MPAFLHFFENGCTLEQQIITVSAFVQNPEKIYALKQGFILYGAFVHKLPTCKTVDFKGCS